MLIGEKCDAMTMLSCGSTPLSLSPPSPPPSVYPSLSLSLQVPVRGRGCKHRTCFNLSSFLQLVALSSGGRPRQSQAWACPLCTQRVLWSQLICDGLRELLPSAVWFSARRVLSVGPSRYKPTRSLPVQYFSTMRVLVGGLRELSIIPMTGPDFLR